MIPVHRVQPLCTVLCDAQYRDLVSARVSERGGGIIIGVFAMESQRLAGAGHLRRSPRPLHLETSPYELVIVRPLSRREVAVLDQPPAGTAKQRVVGAASSYPRVAFRDSFFPY